MQMDKVKDTDSCKQAVAGGLVASKHQDTAQAPQHSRLEDKPLYKMFDIQVHRPKSSVFVLRNL